MISIIVPSFNHLNDALIPCITSLRKYTKECDVEFIVIANGCDDGTEEYMVRVCDEDLRFKLLSSKEPLGYTKAINIGIENSKGEYLVFLNNDTIIQREYWLSLLKKPLEDKDNLVGLTCVKKLYSEETQREFAVFFCVMTTRDVIEEVGLLDEAFNPGYCDDIDWCKRCEDEGFEVLVVSNDMGEFPIIHIPETTVHDPKCVSDWEGIKKRNKQILREKHQKDTKIKSDLALVVSTKNRYDTTLPLLLTSIISNTILPSELQIWDDNDNPKDLRSDKIYNELFQIMSNLGIDWKVIYGEKKGLTYNHIKACRLIEKKYIIRVDDDVILNSDSIYQMYTNINISNAGALGLGISHSFLKFVKTYKDTIYNRISDIRTKENIAWVTIDDEQLLDVEHLNGTCFIYRRESALHMITEYEKYLSKLSPLCFREDTIWTNGMLRLGYGLKVLTGNPVWHLSMSSPNEELMKHDEEIFKDYLGNNKTIIVLDNGLGDHLIFKSVLDDCMINVEEFNKTYVLSTSYPEVFPEYNQISIQEARDSMRKEDYDKWNLYAYMWENNWKGTIKDAYSQLFKKLCNY